MLSSDTDSAGTYGTAAASYNPMPAPPALSPPTFLPRSSKNCSSSNSSSSGSCAAQQLLLSYNTATTAASAISTAADAPMMASYDQYHQPNAFSDSTPSHMCSDMPWSSATAAAEASLSVIHPQAYNHTCSNCCPSAFCPHQQSQVS